MIRILIAEDSPVQRAIIRMVLEEESDFTIVGEAEDGLKAVSMTEQLRPDIVLMDVHMPGIDGIEATRQIMERCPTPIVIVSASVSPEEIEITFDAIKIGALAVLPKPADPNFDQQADEIVRTLRLMSEVKVVGRRIHQREASPSPRPLPPPRELSLVAIAGSTGAPAVICDILAGIAAGLKVPVAVVQHMSPGFVEGFATWLGQRTGLTVTVAKQGELAVAAHVYLAPDGTQMGVDRSGRFVLADAPPEEGFKPSANYLFRSVAHAFGRGAMGVLLTGMGRDGATGLLALREAGGFSIAQDQASCVVFGMPAEAIKLGAASLVLPPPEIVQAIIASRPAATAAR